MELTYTKCGDYLIPDLVLSDTKEYPYREIWPVAPCLLKRTPAHSVYQSYCH